MSAYITLLGAPGSGKGTQANMISSTLNIPIVGIGDLIRSEISKKSSLGEIIAPMVNKGLLVPDSIITDIFKLNITQNLLQSGVIADGFPRNINQSISFDEIFSVGLLKTIVFYIKVPTDILKLRLLSRGRADDTESVILTRNQVYENSIQPILNFFGDRVVVVDGNREESVVFNEMLKMIKDRA